MAEATTLDAEPFDLKGPLPSGVTVLEASAGTGKTYTIAALTARFIAEGAASLDQLLLVTFTRAATSELRERVRERLVVTEAQLARVAAGALPTHIDEVIDHLAGDRVEVVRERQERLADAIANFDAATIETTHGFCQKVLDGLGTLAESDPTVSFVDNVDDLAREVVDDLYVRRFYRDHDGLTMSRPEAEQVARVAIDNPLAPIYPLDPRPGSTPGDALSPGGRDPRRTRRAQARPWADDPRRPAHAPARHAQGSARSRRRGDAP